MENRFGVIKSENISVFLLDKATKAMRRDKDISNKQSIIQLQNGQTAIVDTSIIENINNVYPWD